MPGADARTCDVSHYRTVWLAPRVAATARACGPRSASAHLAQRGQTANDPRRNASGVVVGRSAR